MEASAAGVNEEPCEDGQQGCAGSGQRRGAGRCRREDPPREENKERMQQRRPLLFLNSVSL